MSPDAGFLSLARGNMTGESDIRCLRGRLHALRAVRGKYSHAFGNAEQAVYHLTLSQWLIELAWQYYAQGRFGEAGELFRQSAPYHPADPRALKYSTLSRLPMHARILGLCRRLGEWRT